MIGQQIRETWRLPSFSPIGLSYPGAESKQEELLLRQTQSTFRSGFMQDTVTGAFLGANPNRRLTF